MTLVDPGSEMPPSFEAPPAGKWGTFLPLPFPLGVCGEQGEQGARTPELCSLVRPCELRLKLGRGPPRLQGALALPVVDGASLRALRALGRRPGPRGWALLPELPLQFLV